MLANIVKKYGGELFNNGTRALIPAPFHSADDRSVSVFLTGDNKVRVHCFTDTRWSDVLRTFRDDNLIRYDGTLTDLPASAPSPIPVITDAVRLATAERLWSHCVPVEGTLSERHLTKWRRISRCVKSREIGHSSAMPMAVYKDANTARTIPAIVSRISDCNGRTVGIEAQYLSPSGARTTHLKFNRKTVGHLTPFKSIAVRIDAASTAMVIGEGIASTLSASDEYSLPCWALLSSNNYDNFLPPEGLKELVIAGENDKLTRTKIDRLKLRLEAAGVKVYPKFVPAPYKDLNDYRGGRAA